MLDNFKKGLAKAAGQPLVQFLVLGAVFYALYAWTAGPAAGEDDNVIRVTAAEVSRLDAAWRARWNREPTEEELAGLVNSYIREEALYRHAVAMGLDQNDTVIRRMLGRKLQNLTENLVELSLSPTDQELRTYFEAHADRYRLPDLITFTHVFINPDLREETTLEDAEVVLGELRSLGEPDEGIEDYGDRFMLQRYFPRKPELEVMKLFGQGFTESLFELAPGEWHGPVLSGYGVHLVYVHDLEQSSAPEFAAVEERVKQDWMDDKRKEFQEAYMDEVLSRYEVVFEDLTPEPSDPRSEDRAERSE